MKEAIDNKQLYRRLVRVAAPIQFIQNMFVMAITAAGSILGAQYWGKGDRDAMQSLFHLMLRFSGLISVLFFVACELAPDYLMAAFTNDEMLTGIGSATGILVGNELGAGRLERGKAYGVKLMRFSYGLGLASTALVLAITPLIVRVVLLTETAQSYLTGMMCIMAVYMIGRCVNTVTINGIMDGGGDTVFDMYSLAVCMWGIAIPVALLGAFVFHWPVLLVYACTCLDEVGKIPWVMIRFRKYKWVRNLTQNTR